MTGGRGPRLVVGVGNPDAGDDAAGRLVARHLRQQAGNGGRDAGEGPVVRECSGEATALMEAWRGFDDVVVVDACRGGGAPGRILRFEADQLEGLASLQPRHRSTHGFGVCLAVGLACALALAPRRLVVYAVEGREFETGARVSPEVEQAACALARLLARPEQAGADPGT